MVLELAKGKLPVFVFILSLYLHIFISCGHVMLKDYAEISRMLQKAHPKNPCTAAAEVQWDLNSGEHFTWVQQLSSPCHAFAQNCSRLQRDICSFQSHIRKFASFYLLSFFPTGSISEEEESFAPLFLLSIVSSYHSNNSMAYSKFYLGFLKEHERRTGRGERFEEVMREFYKWSSRAEMSYTSISYVKMLL